MQLLAPTVCPGPSPRQPRLLLWRPALSAPVGPKNAAGCSMRPSSLRSPVCPALPPVCERQRLHRRPRTRLRHLRRRQRVELRHVQEGRTRCGRERLRELSRATHLGCSCGSRRPGERALSLHEEGPWAGPGAMPCQSLIHHPAACAPAVRGAHCHMPLRCQQGVRHLLCHRTAQVRHMQELDFCCERSRIGEWASRVWYAALWLTSQAALLALSPLQP